MQNVEQNVRSGSAKDKIAQALARDLAGNRKRDALAKSANEDQISIIEVLPDRFRQSGKL